MQDQPDGAAGDQVVHRGVQLPVPGVSPECGTTTTGSWATARASACMARSVDRSHHWDVLQGMRSGPLAAAYSTSPSKGSTRRTPDRRPERSAPALLPDQMAEACSLDVGRARVEPEGLSECADGRSTWRAVRGGLGAARAPLGLPGASSGPPRRTTSKPAPRTDGNHREAQPGRLVVFTRHFKRLRQMGGSGMTDVVPLLGGPEERRTRSPPRRLDGCGIGRRWPWRWPCWSSCSSSPGRLRRPLNPTWGLREMPASTTSATRSCCPSPMAPRCAASSTRMPAPRCSRHIRSNSAMRNRRVCFSR